MVKIVIDVIDYTVSQMNGQPFEMYKLKILDEDRVYITDGFRYPREAQIEPYDVIEDMVVVSKLTKEERCEAYYKSMSIEENYSKHIEIAKSESEKRGIWIPCNFGETITVDGVTGIFSSISHTYSYMNEYTYFLVDSKGRIVYAFTGKREDVNGKYVDLSLLPGEKRMIDRWFPYTQEANLIYIEYKNGKYEYRFTGADCMPEIFITDKLLINNFTPAVPRKKEVIKNKIEVVLPKNVLDGQLSLF